MINRYVNVLFGFQDEILKALREKEADYLIAVKANQKNLYDAIKNPSVW